MAEQAAVTPAAEAHSPQLEVMTPEELEEAAAQGARAKAEAE